jgi:hypothetical protein
MFAQDAPSSRCADSTCNTRALETSEQLDSAASYQTCCSTSSSYVLSTYVSRLLLVHQTLLQLQEMSARLGSMRNWLRSPLMPRHKAFVLRSIRKRPRLLWPQRSREPLLRLPNRRPPRPSRHRPLLPRPRQLEQQHLLSAILRACSRQLSETLNRL